MDPAYQIDDTFAWFVPNLKGEHDFKFGASWYYLPLHVFDATNLNGTFTFSASDRDFNAADARTYPDRFSIRVPGVSDFFVKGNEIGVFVQDKWKVNSRVTASLGLRYDVEIVKMDNTGNFLFSAGQDSPVDTNNFSPRVGGTWTLDDGILGVVGSEDRGIEVVVRVPPTIEEVLHLLAGHGALGLPSAGDGRTIARHQALFFTPQTDEERIISKQISRRRYAST